MAKRPKLIQMFKKTLKQRSATRYIAVGALVSVAMLLYVVMNTSTLPIDTKTVRPLLELIADAESNGNYNAYFGNAANQSPKFTEMSIDNVQQWQSEYVAGGSPSSAVGRYQFLDSTLAGLVEELSIDSNQKFDEQTQDELAVQLIKRRGAVEYVNNELSAKQFAANLAKEWASLPKTVGDDPSKSYYARDGLNKAHVSVDKLLGAVKIVQPFKP